MTRWCRLSRRLLLYRKKAYTMVEAASTTFALKRVGRPCSGSAVDSAVCLAERRQECRGNLLDSAQRNRCPSASLRSVRIMGAIKQRLRMALIKYKSKSITLILWLVVVAALGIGVFAMQKSKGNDSQRLAQPGEVQTNEIARNDETRLVCVKLKVAGRACFAAAKEKQKKASMLYEGADVLLRNGKTLTIRVRTLDNDSSDSYRRGIFTCEIVEKGESWSVVRIEPAG